MTDAYLLAHPQINAAVLYGLEILTQVRPEDPVAFLAARLMEFGSLSSSTVVTTAHSASASGATSAAGGAGAGVGVDAEAVEDEGDRRRRMDAQKRMKRRSNVFSEPVKLDRDWKPNFVPKSEEQKADIAKVLAGNVLFSGMEDSQRAIIIDAMEEKRFRPGDIIIQQGDPGDYYYILCAGACRVLKDGVTVLQCTKGMGFGELALMYDAPRAATVQAVSEGVVAWAIDRITFKQVMIGTTQRRREMYEEFLQSVPILATLAKDEQLTVADALLSQSFVAGEVIVREGDTHADRFYIVEEGELMGTKAGVAGEVCPRLNKGAYFGERALIVDAPRAATITAVVPSKCAVMDRAAFLRLIGPMSDLLKRNMSVYATFESDLATVVDPRPDQLLSDEEEG